MSKLQKNTQTQLARTNQLNGLRQELQRTQKVWAKQVPQSMAKALAAERVIQVVLLAASKKGSLILQCTPKSIVGSLADAMSLGLEPNGALGHGYLVPFFNKDLGSYEAQFMVGYKGLVALARRSGEIVSVEAHGFYEHDNTKIILGTECRIEHEPYMDGDRGAMRGVYCIARFVGGGSHMDFMSVADVERIRKNAPSGNSPAWKRHFDEMAKKTVVRRASKYWPLSADLAAALASHDDVRDDPDDSFAGVIDMSFDDDAEAENDEAGVLDDGEAQEEAAEPSAKDDPAQDNDTDYYRRQAQHMINGKGK